VAKTLNNIATVLDSQGKFNEALPFFERAIRILEKALGADHPDVARSLAHLAVSLVVHGHCDEALKHVERGLGILERRKGPEAHDTKILRRTHQHMEEQCAPAAAVAISPP